jgi:hypothetical protein
VAAKGAVEAAVATSAGGSSPTTIEWKGLLGDLKITHCGRYVVDDDDDVVFVS